MTTTLPNQTPSLVALHVEIDGNELSVVEAPILAWAIQGNEPTPVTVAPTGALFAVLDKDTGRAWGMERRYPSRAAAEHDLLALARLALSQEDFPRLHATRSALA